MKKSKKRQQKVEKKIFTVKDQLTGQFLQYVTPTGIPCWSTCWVYFFSSKEEAKKAIDKITEETGLSRFEIIALKYKEREPQTTITYTT